MLPIKLFGHIFLQLRSFNIKNFIGGGARNHRPPKYALALDATYQLLHSFKNIIPGGRCVLLKASDDDRVWIGTAFFGKLDLDIVLLLYLAD